MESATEEPTLAANAPASEDAATAPPPESSADDDPGPDDAAVVDCYMNEPGAPDETEITSPLFAGSALYAEDELGEGLLQALTPQKQQALAAETAPGEDDGEAAVGGGTAGGGAAVTDANVETGGAVEEAESADAAIEAAEAAVEAAEAAAEVANVDPAEMVDDGVDEPPPVEVETAAVEPVVEVPVEEQTETNAAVDPTQMVLDIDDDDLVDDIVPIVSYDDKKSQFSKNDRLIMPKNGHFPSIFCALNVVVRLEPLGVDSNLAVTLPDDDVARLLREDFDLGASLVHWEEGSACPAGSAAREIMAAMNAELPHGLGAGSSLKLEQWGVVATIIEVTETGEDVDPSRITTLAQRFKECPDCDAVVFELPQVWVIPDRDFRAKTASIGLYPGSYWAGFMKCWGLVQTSEIFFRTVKKKVGPEPFVHLLVQFRDREALKMCFAFLYGRYLAHPKKEFGLRQPHCMLASFAKFKGQACNQKAAPKAALKPGAKAAAKVVKGVAAPKKKVVKGIRFDGSLEYGDAGSVQKPLLRPQSKASASKRAPITPMPKPDAVDATPSSPPLKEFAEAPSPVAAPAAPAAAPPAEDAADDRALTPAEAMKGLSGKQLEAFQMVMSRMERLERENQELMQILLQMQGLLQQQQQRNARLTQAAGYAASGSDPLGATHGHMLPPQPPPNPQLPMHQPPPPQFGLSSLPRGPVHPRQLEIPAPPTMPVLQMPAMPAMLPRPSQMQLRPQAPLALDPYGGKRSAEQMQGHVVVQMPPLTPQTPGALADATAGAAGRPVDPAPWKSLRKRQRVSKDSTGKAAVGGEPSQGFVEVEGVAPAAPPAAATQDAKAALAAYNNALLGE